MDPGRPYPPTQCTKSKASDPTPPDRPADNPNLRQENGRLATRLIEATEYLSLAPAGLGWTRLVNPGSEN